MEAVSLLTREKIMEEYDALKTIFGRELSLEKNLNDLVLLVAYQGFEPLQIARLLAKHNKEYTTRGIKIEFGGFKWEDSSDLKTDVELMILIFAQRGSSLAKMHKKSNREFITLVDALTAKYHLSSRKGKDLGTDDITLPRVASTFAAKTAQLFFCHKANIIIDRNLAIPNNLNLQALKHDDKFYPIPEVLLCPCFASVIPPVEKITEENNIKYILLYVAKCLDMVIGTKNAPNVVLSGYIDNAERSKVYTPEERVGFSVSWQLGTAVKENKFIKWNAEVLDMIAICRSLVAR